MAIRTALVVLVHPLSAQKVDTAVVAAPRRATPGPVYEPPAFARAVRRGTRTRTGVPGARAWVQRARYAIDATAAPQTLFLQ